jgi:Tryptophan-rich sensory protein (mitochondrial benzodiazepine receptor homolog)
MNQLASPGQLRASVLRWALLMVPLVLLLGILSGQVAGSGPGNPWFDALVKPAIYPPPAAFGIVWSILYILMGIAAAMVAAARGAPGRGMALALFFVQLALNLAWTPVFFAFHQLSGALYLIIALDIAVIATIAAFWRVRVPAALLLVPYLAWILFATVLSWQFLQANPGADGQAGPAPVTRIQL